MGITPLKVDSEHTILDESLLSILDTDDRVQMQREVACTAACNGVQHSTRRYSTVCLTWKCKTESLTPFKTIRQKDHGQARKSGASKADSRYGYFHLSNACRHFIDEAIGKPIMFPSKHFVQNVHPSLTSVPKVKAEYWPRSQVLRNVLNSYG